MVAELADETRPEIKSGHGEIGTEYGTGPQSPQKEGYWLLNSKMLKMEGYLEMILSTFLVHGEDVKMIIKRPAFKELPVCAGR